MDLSETVTVTFAGIQNANEYLRLIGYLEKHAQVGRIVPVRAGAEQAVFTLELKQGLAGFRNAVARDGVVAAVEGAEEGAVVFDVR